MFKQFPKNYNLFLDHGISASSFDAQGPTFAIEPPMRLEFTNNMGGRADCIAKANPSPNVEWYHMDNSIVTTIPKVFSIYNGYIYIRLLSHDF